MGRSSSISALTSSIAWSWSSVLLIREECLKFGFARALPAEKLYPFRACRSALQVEEFHLPICSTDCLTRSFRRFHDAPPSRSTRGFYMRCLCCRHIFLNEVYLVRRHVEDIVITVFEDKKNLGICHQLPIDVSRHKQRSREKYGRHSPQLSGQSG